MTGTLTSTLASGVSLVMDADGALQCNLDEHYRSNISVPCYGWNILGQCCIAAAVGKFEMKLSSAS